MAMVRVTDEWDCLGDGVDKNKVIENGLLGIHFFFKKTQTVIRVPTAKAEIAKQLASQKRRMNNVR